jgi:hypothetical protein
LQSACPSVSPSVHTFVTDISASTGRNDFIFDIWLWHGDLYRASPFQVYRTSTSCLQCDLEFCMFAEKIALRATKKNNILTLVLSEKKFLNERKNHNPPLQVKWSVPYIHTCMHDHSLSWFNTDRHFNAKWQC